MEQRERHIQLGKEKNPYSSRKFKNVDVREPNDDEFPNNERFKNRNSCKGRICVV